MLQLPHQNGVASQFTRKKIEQTANSNYNASTLVCKTAFQTIGCIPNKKRSGDNDTFDAVTNEKHKSEYKETIDKKKNVSREKHCERYEGGANEQILSVNNIYDDAFCGMFILYDGGANEHMQSLDQPCDDALGG
ncbi:hypothetical protein Bhyg_12062 [Pseudolycoriella hygida]|uniref:Uncharacterized protein n=1 Tax=Pseudolycoriella hygida TaxID=35572 RepID=A0A9Q0S0X3_9DIPT|nr:hypothetical protein Bhyg_12062 [Pseudolycoriella hygida]